MLVRPPPLEGGELRTVGLVRGAALGALRGAVLGATAAGLREGTLACGVLAVGARPEGARAAGARLVGTLAEGARAVGPRLVGTLAEGARLEGTLAEGARLEGPLAVGVREVGALVTDPRLFGILALGARPLGVLPAEGSRLVGVRTPDDRPVGVLFTDPRLLGTLALGVRALGVRTPGDLTLPPRSPSEGRRGAATLAPDLGAVPRALAAPLDARGARTPGRLVPTCPPLDPCPLRAVAEGEAFAPTLGRAWALLATALRGFSLKAVAGYPLFGAATRTARWAGTT